MLICKATGITRRELKSRSRIQSLVAARQYAMVLLADLGLKDKVIGRILHRDRVTVMYHRRRAKELLEYGDPILEDVKNKVEKLWQKCLQYNQNLSYFCENEKPGTDILEGVGADTAAEQPPTDNKGGVQ